MSLMAEIVVEEWLNRQGYFTIRGIKVGNDEIDLLAVRLLAGETIERRHIEVQASTKPNGYITRRSANRCTPDELQASVEDWIAKKYTKPNKLQILESIGHGAWTRELVIHNVRWQEEVDLIRQRGVQIVRLSTIVDDLRHGLFVVPSASGADLLELMHLTSGEVMIGETGKALDCVPVAHHSLHQEWITRKRARLDEPHIAPLTAFVRRLNEQYPHRKTPNFDPDDGGISGRVLFLKEAPGPTAIESGFVAPENKGNTARNMRELREQSGLDKCFIVNWNIVPWYVGNEAGSKIKPASSAEVREGAACLKELLKLLPEVRVVILMGNKAQRGWNRWMATEYGHLGILCTSHPSPLALNGHPEHRDDILEKFRLAQSIASASDTLRG